VINSDAKNIYRYMNFNQLEDYNKTASEVVMS